MRCRWTPSDCPFCRGIRVYQAIFDGRIFNTLTASFTLFDDWMATASIKTASFFGHKGAFITFLDSFTKHGNHPLLIFGSIGQKKRAVYAADAPIVANGPDKLTLHT